MRVICEPRWRPAESDEEIGRADRLRRVDGRIWIAIDVSMMACLSHNLAVVAGLERAYALGADRAHMIWTRDEIVPHRDWSPGCGRGAP